MNGETFDDNKETVSRLTPDAFAHHVLRERRPWVWKVSRPDSWTYGFFVLMAPGALFVYGDLGEATFRMNARSEKEVFDWTMRCVPHDWHYVLSKISNREAFRKFYPGDALAYAKSCVKEASEFERKSAGDPPASRRARAAREFLADVQIAVENGELSPYEYYRTAHEHDQYDVPQCENWTAGALWIHAALETFVRLKPEMPAGEPDGQSE